MWQMTCPSNERQRGYRRYLLRVAPNNIRETAIWFAQLGARLSDVFQPAPFHRPGELHQVMMLATRERFNVAQGSSGLRFARQSNVGPGRVDYSGASLNFVL